MNDLLNGANWILKTYKVLNESRPVLLTGTYSSRFLAATVVRAGVSDNWYRAGYLSPFLVVPALGGTPEFGNYLVMFRRVLIFDVNPPVVPYKLRFESLEWVEPAQLKVWEFTGPTYQLEQMVSGVQEALNQQAAAMARIEAELAQLRESHP